MEKIVDRHIRDQVLFKNLQQKQQFAYQQDK